MTTSIFSSQQAEGENVDIQVSEHARVVLQPGKTFNAESVLAMPVTYRERLSGARPEIAHLWLWPQSGQVTAAVRYQKNLFSKKEVCAPFSPGAPLEPAKAGGVELYAKVPVFCTDEHRQEVRYRLGQLEGLTVAARTGLANGLVVRVRAHPEADMTSSADPQAPLVAVAGRRLVLSPAWVRSTEREGLVLKVFPAQAASSVEFLDDWQVHERIWAILGENPALQPYLSWLNVEVKDGVAYLSGRLPQPRLRNSAKQDIWHIPGVVGIEDALRVEGN